MANPETCTRPLYTLVMTSGHAGTKHSDDLLGPGHGVAVDMKT